MFSVVLFVFSAIVLIVQGKNEDYMGFKIYNVKLETQEQQNRFSELKSDSVDYLRKPSLKYNIVGRAMVPPSHFIWFEEQLQELGIKRDIAIEDVYQHLTDIEKTFVRTSRKDDDNTVASSTLNGNVNRNDDEEESEEELEEEDDGIVFDFDGYYRYDEILNHLLGLEEAFVDSPTSVTVEEYGVTDQNRPLVFLKIEQNSNTVENRPVVIIEAGINPREWITIPAALNIANRVVENQNQFLDRADWIIIPVVNPDGYEYTHTNLRLWSKNFSTRSNLGFICPGVNINRNFDISWQISDASSSPCSHLYAGTEAFSEPEAQMVRYILQEYGQRTRLYVSLQNNGGFISYPWHYERAASGMFRQHHFLGMEMVSAMNDEYNLDVGWQALGDRASGTSTDFAQESGILFSFNVDAVQRGIDGVNIPEVEIVDVIEDVWRAVAVAADNLL